MARLALGWRSGPCAAWAALCDPLHKAVAAVHRGRSACARRLELSEPLSSAALGCRTQLHLITRRPWASRTELHAFGQIASPGILKLYLSSNRHLPARARRRT
ncbi:hypothetical protein TSOC_000030 [Tetrabaena socialis]|uniref:Uncharacterized protein n=1 Tax=Tetrabaena socialis TaxID=47790 RepID=A0A2J8AKD3_9CHLO|nr:hypothetical protein TSOC_000030 [Tetrabaena socialis]|eukprot:PNH12973.1 hypothetical protein TSOC_000030 [Tetrabaena socialis]